MDQNLFYCARRKFLLANGIPVQPQKFTCERKEKCVAFKENVKPQPPFIFGDIGCEQWIIGLLWYLDEPKILTWEDVQEWLLQPETLAFFMDCSPLDPEVATTMEKLKADFVKSSNDLEFSLSQDSCQVLSESFIGSPVPDTLEEELLGITKYLFYKREQLIEKGFNVIPQEFTHERKSRCEELLNEFFSETYGEVGTDPWIIGLLGFLHEPTILTWDDIVEWLQDPEIKAFFANPLSLTLPSAKLLAEAERRVDVISAAPIGAGTVVNPPWLQCLFPGIEPLLQKVDDPLVDYRSPTVANVNEACAEFFQKCSIQTPLPTPAPDRMLRKRKIPKESSYLPVLFPERPLIPIHRARVELPSTSAGYPSSFNLDPEDVRPCVQHLPKFLSSFSSKIPDMLLEMPEPLVDSKGIGQLAIPEPTPTQGELKTEQPTSNNTVSGPLPFGIDPRTEFRLRLVPSQTATGLGASFEVNPPNLLGDENDNVETLKAVQ